MSLIKTNWNSFNAVPALFDDFLGAIFLTGQHKLLIYADTHSDGKCERVSREF